MLLRGVLALVRRTRLGLCLFGFDSPRRRNACSTAKLSHFSSLTCTIGVCIIASLTSPERHPSNRDGGAEGEHLKLLQKVREQEDVAVKVEEGFSSVLRAIEILAIDVQPSLKSPAANYGTKSENDPPLWHEKNHKSLVSSPASSLSTSRGKSAKIVNDDNRTKKRASSVPRPRAVLSSPDNDDIIGKQNRVSKRQASPPIQSPSQKTHALSQKNAGVGTPRFRKEASKDYGNCGDMKERKISSEVAVLRQRIFVKRV